MQNKLHHYNLVSSIYWQDSSNFFFMPLKRVWTNPNPSTPQGTLLFRLWHSTCKVKRLWEMLSFRLQKTPRYTEWTIVDPLFPLNSIFSHFFQPLLWSEYLKTKRMSFMSLFCISVVFSIFFWIISLLSFSAHRAGSRCNHPGSGGVGEGGQWFSTGYTGECGRCTVWVVHAVQRQLPAHSSGGCAAGHRLPGLLRRRQGEQVHAADGERR